MGRHPGADGAVNGDAWPPTTVPRPEVRLLHGPTLGVDEAGLRAHARTLTTTMAAPWCSRSYRFPYALVAWHEAPVGIDIEHIGRRPAAFADLICTPEERLALDGERYLDGRLTSLWSSKEALAKALGDARRFDPSQLGSPTGWPALRAGRWQASPLPVPPDHVGWVCWRLSPPPETGRPDTANAD
jgi:hypothetical protein